MIKEINIDNISILNDPFLRKRKIKEEILKNPFAKVLIYLQNKQVIAYLYYSDIYERVELNQIEVDISYRNYGIGSILMNHLIQLVDKSITLEVKINNIFALKLYKKYGFKKVAIRKGYYQGIDGILMERNNNQ